jgi:hypothetical protein
MENHTNGYKHDDITIQSCWDSDRLDLGRVDITPSPDYLSEEASAYISQAYLSKIPCWLKPRTLGRKGSRPQRVKRSCIDVAAVLVGVCAAPTKTSKHPTDREDSSCTVTKLFTKCQ